jgi:hypothetical protein
MRKLTTARAACTHLFPLLYNCRTSRFGENHGQKEHRQRPLGLSKNACRAAAGGEQWDSRENSKKDWIAKNLTVSGL